MRRLPGADWRNIEQGQVKVQLDPAAYTLATLADAYDAISKSTAKGKLVVQIA
jgi:hypothetical protein